MPETIQIACPSCLTANRIPTGRLAEEPRCGKCKTPLLPASPIELDDSSFARYIQRSQLPVVVDLWAAWCGPCKQMAPEFAAASAQRAGRVLFAKLDTEAAPQTAGSLGIRAIPTMVLFQAGAERARQSGAMGSAQILAWVDRNCA